MNCDTVYSHYLPPLTMIQSTSLPSKWPPVYLCSQVPLLASGLWQLLTLVHSPCSSAFPGCYVNGNVENIGVWFLSLGTLQLRSSLTEITNT
jgi:hypothetical protein